MYNHTCTLVIVDKHAMVVKDYLQKLIMYLLQHIWIVLIGYCYSQIVHKSKTFGLRYLTS